MVVALLLGVVLAVAAAAAAGVFRNDTKVDKIDTDMQRLSESVARAWLPLQRNGGAMRINSLGLQRPARNTAYFGSAALSISLRLKSEDEKRKFVDAEFPAFGDDDLWPTMS